MEVCENFRPESIYVIMAWCFLIHFFLKFFALSEFRCMSASRFSSRIYNSLFLLFIHLAFLLCAFSPHILLQNYFVSFAFSCWFAFPTSLLVENYYYYYYYYYYFLFTAYQFFTKAQATTNLLRSPELVFWLSSTML